MPAQWEGEAPAEPRLSIIEKTRLGRSLALPKATYVEAVRAVARRKCMDYLSKK